MPQQSILHHVLPNGLTLLAEPMAGVQSAAFTLLIPAGSAYEAEGRDGAASMLAEWMMRGAGERDSRDLLTALDHLGVSHSEGAQTAHLSIAAATLGRNMLPALDIFADIVLRPQFDPDELEPIRALALQSLQSLEDDPASKVIYELRKRHFPHPWGRPSPGTPEGVEATTGDELRAFHARHVRPDQAILAVAGAVEWPQLRDHVERILGDWTSQPDPVVAERPTAPSREHILRETQQTQVAIAYPTAPVSDPSYYRARATAAILGGYASARLFTEVREKRGLCYSVYASYEGLRDRAAVICYAGTSNDRAQETLDLTIAEIERLARDGVEPEELDMMRAGLKSSLIMQQESSLSRSGSLASDWYFLGRVRPLDEIASALDALTADSVSEFASRQPIDQATIVTLGPIPLRWPSSTSPKSA